MAATGTYAPQPFWQFFTNAGAPLAGGLVFTYEAGTTTKLATYTDINLSVANTNPIVLDSAGRCTMFLLAAAYKFVVSATGDTDPPTSPIATRDNISAVSGFNINIDVTATAGEALTANELVYLSDGSGGLTAGRWYKADADNTYSSTAATAMGFVVSDIASAASGSVRIVGRVTGLAGLTIGAVYYASATAGAITSSAPANARQVAVADSATSVVLSQWLGVPVATTTLAGIVSTTTQSFGGAKTFAGAVLMSSTLGVTGQVTASGGVRTSGPPTFDIAGAGAGTYGGTTPYRISTNVTDVGNVGAGEDDLMTYSLPAGVLATDLQAARVTAWGTFATNANTKLLRAYFGATGILLVVAGFQPNNAGWRAQFEIIRTGAATQILTGYNLVRDAANVSYVFTPAEATPAETLSNSITIKMTGEATSDNDIVQKGMIVELMG